MTLLSEPFNAMLNAHCKRLIQDGAGDANDVWQIQVMDQEEGTDILAVKSKFKLIHYYVRCALFSHDKKLPKWWVMLVVV